MVSPAGPNLTKQEYYNLLVKSAYDGTFPSMDGEQCAYRLDHTDHCPQRCAVGLLIPDEWYDDLMEGNSVPDLDSDHFDLIRVPEGLDKEDLWQIQRCHDDYAFAVYTQSQVWNGNAFVEKLNNLHCFSNVVKKEI